MSNSLQPRELYTPWNFLGQNTEVGSCSLLQGIFPTQGSNPGLPHCGRTLYQLSHQGSPNKKSANVGWLAQLVEHETLNLRRNIPQHNKSHIWQTQSKHYPQWWKTESISSKIRNKTKVYTVNTTIQHRLGRFSPSNQRRKINKKNPDWKRRSKSLTVCRCHDPLHRKP